MPQIDLEPIDTRLALINVIASIALEEAALSHVLNAEGEKIQAAVAIEDVTVAELQGINTSVGELTDHVVLIEDALHDKLNTVIDTLHPPMYVDITVAIEYEIGGPAVDSTYAVFKLTGKNGKVYYGTADDDEVEFLNVREGDYTLTQTVIAPSDLYQTMTPATHDISINHDGDILFDGAAVLPSVITPLVTGTFTIQMVDGGNNPIESNQGHFILTSDPGGTPFPAATNPFGLAQYSGIPQGNYILVQDASDPAYNVDSTSHNIVVTNIGTITVDSLPAIDNNILIQNIHI
jgi:hypothetical protein